MRLPLQLQHGPVIAIRREDQSVWERRAPFGPTHVQKLVKQGVKVIVQPSNRRAYPMQVRPLYIFMFMFKIRAQTISSIKALPSMFASYL